MFRILLQTKSASLNNPATYQYLLEDDQVWETAEKEEALTKYTTELDNYKKSIMTLVKVVDVTLEPSADDCLCGDDCTCKTE